MIMKGCNGENCVNFGDFNHSPECEAEHERAYSKIEAAPNCFDRAGDSRNGGGFDNCRFYNSCKQVKPICMDNPIK
jgi:hypothetical protein